MASRIYTAQEMRKMADCINNIKQSEMTSWKEGEIITGGDMCMAAEMLRQAADDAEELARAKRQDACPANPTNKMCYLPGEYCCDLVRYLQKNSTQLNSRLDAVVKECEKQIPACRLEDCKCNPTDIGYCDENCHDEIIVHKAVTAILRVARGDAGKEER